MNKNISALFAGACLPAVAAVMPLEWNVNYKAVGIVSFANWRLVQENHRER